MNRADAVVEVGSRGTHTEAGEIGNAREFLRKDAGDDRLADGNSDSTSDSTEKYRSLSCRSGA